MFDFDQGGKMLCFLVGRKKIIWLGRKTIPPTLVINWPTFIITTCTTLSYVYHALQTIL